MTMLAAAGFLGFMAPLRLKGAGSAKSAKPPGPDFQSIDCDGPVAGVSNPLLLARLSLCLVGWDRIDSMHIADSKGGRFIDMYDD